jgi:hypothetical protein
LSMVFARKAWMRSLSLSSATRLGDWSTFTLLREAPTELTPGRYGLAEGEELGSNLLRFACALRCAP